MNFETLKNTADNFVKEQKYEEGILKYEEIVNIEEFKQHDEMIKVRFNLGFCFFQIKYFQKAREIFELVINKDINYTKAYYYKGLCHFGLGELNEAVEIFLIGKNRFKKEQIFFEKEIMKIKNAEIEKNKNFDFEAFLGDFFSKKDFKNQVGELIQKFNVNIQERFKKFLEFLEAKLHLFTDSDQLFIFKEIYLNVLKIVKSKNSEEIKINDSFLKNLLQSKNGIKIERLFLIKTLTKTEENLVFSLDQFVDPEQNNFEEIFEIIKVFFSESETIEFSNTNLLKIVSKFASFNYTPNKETLQKLEIVLSKLILQKKSTLEIFLSLLNLEVIEAKTVFSLSLMETIFKLIEINEKNSENVIFYIILLFDSFDFILNTLREESLLKKKFLNVLISFFTSNKIFELLKSSHSLKLDQLIEDIKKFKKEPVIVENLIILKLLVEFRFTKKLLFDSETWEFLQILLKVSEREEIFLIISLICQNHIYLKKLLQENLLKEFFKNKKMENFKIYFYFIQTISGIYENTHEEKMKELKNKYQVGNESVEAFEKLNKMMKNSDIEFVKEKELNDLDFTGFLIQEVEIDKKTLFICKHFPQAMQRILPKLIFVLYKIFFKNKFYAAKFISKDFLDFINVYKINLKNASNLLKENNDKAQNSEEIKSLQNQYFEFISRFLAGVEIQNLQEYQKPALISSLCWTLKESSTSLIIFESLLSLTRFAGEKQDYNTLIWQKENLKYSLYEFFLHENTMIKSASIELLNNLIINREVFTDFICLKQTFEFLKHMKDIIVINFNSNKKFTKQDMSFGKDGYLFCVAIGISILICYAHLDSKKYFKKEINFMELREYIIKAFDNEKVVDDMVNKLKLII